MTHAEILNTVNHQKFDASNVKVDSFSSTGSERSPGMQLPYYTQKVSTLKWRRGRRFKNYIKLFKNKMTKKLAEDQIK